MLQNLFVLPGKNTHIFKRALDQLDNAIAEMRGVAHSLMPEALLKFGIAEAIEDLCGSINETDKVKMKFTLLGTLAPIDKSCEVTLYRMVQELSNNAIKHALASNIFIQLPNTSVALRSP